MPAGDARTDFDAMLRAKAAAVRHDPGDPGDPLPAGDPLVSRTVCALRDLHVTGEAVATDVLDAVAAATWLRPEQIAKVLQAFAGWPGLRPVGPAYIPPGQRNDLDD